MIIGNSPPRPVLPHYPGGSRAARGDAPAGLWEPPPPPPSSPPEGCCARAPLCVSHPAVPQDRLPPPPPSVLADP